MKLPSDQNHCSPPAPEDEEESSIIKVMRISKILVPQQGNKAQLFIDGREALKLDKATVERLGLCAEQELSPSFLQYIRDEDIYSGALRVAFRFLQLRLRSTNEIEDKLKPLFPQAIIKRLLHELTEAGLLNDRRVASVLLALRLEQGRRSLREIAAELKRKGFASALIKEIIGEVPQGQDETSALKLAQKRMRQKKKEWDWQSFFEKTSSYLARKGFSYPTIRQVLKRENFPEFFPRNLRK